MTHFSVDLVSCYSLLISFNFENIMVPCRVKIDDKNTLRHDFLWLAVQYHFMSLSPQSDPIRISSQAPPFCWSTVNSGSEKNHNGHNAKLKASKRQSKKKQKNRWRLRGFTKQVDPLNLITNFTYPADREQHEHSLRDTHLPMTASSKFILVSYPPPNCQESIFPCSC